MRGVRFWLLRSLLEVELVHTVLVGHMDFKCLDSKMGRQYYQGRAMIELGNGRRLSTGRLGMQDNPAFIVDSYLAGPAGAGFSGKWQMLIMASIGALSLSFLFLPTRLSQGPFDQSERVGFLLRHNGSSM